MFLVSKVGMTSLGYPAGFQGLAINNYELRMVILPQQHDAQMRKFEVFLQTLRLSKISRAAINTPPLLMFQCEGGPLTCSGSARGGKSATALNCWKVHKATGSCSQPLWWGDACWPDAQHKACIGIIPAQRSGQDGFQKTEVGGTGTGVVLLDWY